MRKKKKLNSKKIYLTLILLTIILVSLVVASQVSKYSDSTKFSEAEKKRSLIIERLVTHLGDRVVYTEDRNVCFNSEQGPYDSGRLWCQTATVVRLDRHVSQDYLGKKFVELANVQGFTAQSSSNHGVYRYWFESNESVSCVFSAVDVNGNELGGATLRPFKEGEFPAFSISCAGRAKAKHYPYID